MLIVYAIALLFGGTLVLASVLLGHHDVDASSGAAALDHDVSVPTDDHPVDAHAGTLWLPFLSLRFWTFGAAFFGLTGVLFHSLALAGEGATLGLAIGAGLVCGLVAALVIRVLSRQEASSLPTELSFVGQPADVLLDVGPSLPGRVRLSVRGSSVDLPAVTEGPQTFARGARALVVEVVDGRARVAPLDGATDAKKT